MDLCQWVVLQDAGQGPLRDVTPHNTAACIGKGHGAQEPLTAGGRHLLTEASRETPETMALPKLAPTPGPLVGASELPGRRRALLETGNPT